MVKKYIILVIVLVIFFISCRAKEPLFLVPEDYTNWEKLSDKPLTYPIPGHMDNYRIIYINEKGSEVKNNSYPDGTIIVKEVYSGLEYKTDDKPIDLTIMVKDSDNPEGFGGWLWLKKSPVEQTETIINVDFCMNCHSNANETHPYGDGNPDNEFRDFVFYSYQHGDPDFSY